MKEMLSLSKKLANIIYEYLVEHCEAPKSFREDFVRAFTNNEYVPREWRFHGKYGLAGKFWWNNEKFYVAGWSRSEISSKDYAKQEKELESINHDMNEFYQAYLVEAEADRRFGQPHYGHNSE